MKEQSNQIAKDLLDIEAIFLPNEPFTWAKRHQKPYLLRQSNHYELSTCTSRPLLKA